MNVCRSHKPDMHLVNKEVNKVSLYQKYVISECELVKLCHPVFLRQSVYSYS